MSLEEYWKRNSILQEKVAVEIEKVKRGQRLKNSCIKKNIPLYYPNVIVDSWDYSDPLGIELMELAALYEKI